MRGVGAAARNYETGLTWCPGLIFLVSPPTLLGWSESEAVKLLHLGISCTYAGAWGLRGQCSSAQSSLRG